MLREYSEAVHTLSEIEKILLQHAITKLNLALAPGHESLNLSSLNIPELIFNCRKAINTFRDQKKQVEKHAKNIEEFVRAIEDAQLMREFEFEGKKDNLLNPSEFMLYFEDHMKRVL